MSMTRVQQHVLKDTRRVSRVLSRLGDKWSVLIIFLLHTRPHRFNEIKRGIEGISQQMLTRALRAMERDGFVSRRIIPSGPPQVEYALTELGVSLSTPVIALGTWACDHVERINHAQSAFDEKNQPSS